MRYRRAFQPGGSFFFTVVTAHRRPMFATATAVALLCDAFRVVLQTRPFHIDAIVVLPDHLHCIWTLPEGDADFMTRWRLFKTWFSKHSELSKVWQARYCEHVLRDEQDFASHVDYIHFNPVKHGLVSKAIDWPYSSFHRFVAQGWCVANWGGDGVNVAGVGRE